LGETARFPVEINEGLGLSLVEIKTLVDGVRGVVITLDDVSPTVFAGPGAGLGAGGLEVSAAVATDATGRETRKDEVAGHHEVDYDVERVRSGDLIQRHCLGHRTGEAVKDVATVSGIVGLDALCHESDHDVIAHEVAGIDHSFGHQTQLGSFTNSSTQHVAR
jgi:hypothetical protein